MTQYVVKGDVKDFDGTDPLNDDLGAEGFFEQLVEESLDAPIFEFSAKNLLGNDWFEKGKKIINDRIPEYLDGFVEKYAPNKRTT